MRPKDLFNGGAEEGEVSVGLCVRVVSGDVFEKLVHGSALSRPDGRVGSDGVSD